MDPSSRQLVPLDRSSSPPLDNARQSFPPTPRNSRFRQIAESDPIGRSAKQFSQHLIKSEELAQPEPLQRGRKRTPLVSKDSAEDSPPRISLSGSSPKLNRNGEIETRQIWKVTYGSTTHADEEDSEEIVQKGVSEEFINTYNTIFGDQSMHLQAEQLTTKMRQLAGLEDSKFPINISQARIGLCMLARLKDERLKSVALDSLLALMLNDPLSDETAENLTTFASNFFKLVTRKEYKLERPPIQSQIGVVYDYLLHILQSQYEFKRLAPITPDLKAQLTNAAIVLGKATEVSDYEGKDYTIDIPLIRLMLCSIAENPDEQTILEALNSLASLLKYDPCTLRTSELMVELATNYLSVIKLDKFEAVTPKVQLKMIAVFDSLILLLNSHFAQGHITAITKELKDNLVRISKTLRTLNTHRNTSFAYHAACALEGARQLEDDRQELFAYLKRGFQVVGGLLAIGLQEVDAGVSRVENEFRQIDIRGFGKWYDSVLMLEKLGKDAYKSSSILNETLHYIGYKTPGKGKKHTVDRWEFFYTGAKVLRDICLNGGTHSIRMTALTGGGDNSPGLEKLLNFEINHKGGKKELKKDSKPNSSVFVREFVIDCLVEIINTSKDNKVIINARSILESRVSEEKDPGLLNKLANLPIKHVKKPRRVSF